MNVLKIRNEMRSGKSIFDLPLRVTFYARVSTDKDEQLNSLENQVQYYTELIQSKPNWTYIPGYIDEGISGTSTRKRDSFLRMISDAKAGRFDFIITKEISRFSRSTLDSIQYTQELLEHDVGVLFQNDNINTLDSDSEFRLVVMAGVAQDEVRKLSERLKFGFRQAIKNGHVLGNDKLWGYDKKDCVLTINEAEATVVRRIFHLYANEQMGIRRISQQLYDEGFTSRKGNAFNVLTIRHILENPKYKGWYCANKSQTVDYRSKRKIFLDESEWVMYPDPSIPAIVSEELWDRANALYKRRSAQMMSHQSAAEFHNRYPYSGKIICGIHHEPYYRSLYRYKSGNKEVWQCQEYSKRGKSGCRSPIIYTSELDDIMRKSLEEVTMHKAEIVHELIQVYSSIESGAEIEKSVTKCKMDMDDILRRKDKLLDLSIDGRITDQEFSARNNRFNEELEKLQQQLQELEAERLKNKDMMQSIDMLRQVITKELNFENGFSEGVIDTLLDHIEVNGTDKKNEISAKVYLKAMPEAQKYSIQRIRGNTSVCTRQYT